MAARMTPTLGMGQSGLFGSARLGGVAVGQQDRSQNLGQAERGADVVMSAGGVEREAHLVALAVDRPEVPVCILPWPERPALIGVSSMALTRLCSTEAY